MDDYHSFSLGMSNTFSFLLDGLRGDANVEVLDLDGNIVFSSTNSGVTAESISGMLEAGAYRLRVCSVDGTSTAYKLDLSVTPTMEGITTEGSEAPIYLETAQSLPLINVFNFRSGNTALGSRPEFTGINGARFATVIIDTGIDDNHPFFGLDNDGNGIADRIIDQFDFAWNDNIAEDIHGHGSNVASIAASENANVPGVAPAADIIALKVFQELRDANGNPRRDNGNVIYNPEFNVFAAVEQALHRVIANAERWRVASVNLSLGDGGNYQTEKALYGLGEEFKVLARQNVVVVAAAATISSRTKVGKVLLILLLPIPIMTIIIRSQLEQYLTQTLVKLLLTPMEMAYLRQ